MPKKAVTLDPELDRAIRNVFSDESFNNKDFDDDTWRVAGTNHDEYHLRWGSIVLKGQDLNYNEP